MDTEEKLCNDKRVQEALEVAPVGAFQTDMNGHVFFVNKEWEKISGLSFEESLGESWLKIVLEEDIPAITYAIQQGTENVKEITFLYRIRHPKKGIRYLKTNAKPFFDAKGKGLSFTGYVQDVTEKQHSTAQIKQQNKLFSILKSIQDRFYLSESPYELFNTLLDDILKITESEFGFIGEILHNEKNGQPYLRTLAISNIAWDEKSRKIYENTKTDGVIFDNLNTIFGQVISTGESYISNAPSTDEKRGGTPKGHPVLQSFIGLPAKTNNQLVGMIGIANRKNDYDKTFEDFLAPLLSTFASLIAFHRVSKEKKLAETRKEELTNHLQALITSLEDIILEIDGNHIFQNVWVHDEKILFMPKANFLGKSLSDVFGTQAEQFFAPIRSVIETGQTAELEYRHIDPSIEKWYKAKITPVNKDPDPASYKLVIIIQDITKRIEQEQVLKEITQQLERSHLLLEASQELSKTGGWENNIETGEILWTKQHHEIMGISVEEVKDMSYQNLFEYVVKEDVDIIKNAFEKSINEKTTYDAIFRIITPDNQQKWVRSIGSPVIRDGKVIMLRGAIMDITQKKATEMELIMAKNMAENAAQANTDFLSVMSHEIRTPLNGIIGITNLLKLSHSLEQEEYIDNLAFSAGHLLQLINDILDLNKIESDKLELVYTEIDLSRLILSIKNQFKSLADTKGIKLLCRIDKNIPGKIVGDIVRISQILNNLISNAIKFTDEGSVTVQLQQLSLTPAQSTIHFSVKDTGLGIPEKMQEVIFESFKQIQQSAYRKHSGTGLGLTITKKLIELHNSQIFIISKAGKGSEFYFDVAFDLPTDKNRKIKSADSLLNHEKKLSKIQLLLVEENLVNTLVAKKQLEYFGIMPDCAQNGDEALSLLNKRDYHIALIDLHMPKIDGYDLSRIIRKQHPNVHIIIFTADIMNEVKKRLAKMGIYDILNKPFIPEEMFSILLKVAKEKSIL